MGAAEQLVHRHLHAGMVGRCTVHLIGCRALVRVCFDRLVPNESRWWGAMALHFEMLAHDVVQCEIDRRHGGSQHPAALEVLAAVHLHAARAPSVTAGQSIDYIPCTVPQCAETLNAMLRAWRCACVRLRLRIVQRWRAGRMWRRRTCCQRAEMFLASCPTRNCLKCSIAPTHPGTARSAFVILPASLFPEQSARARGGVSQTRSSNVDLRIRRQSGNSY